MKRSKRFFGLILLFSVFLFSSCSGGRATPRAAVGELLAAHSLPSGVVYTSASGGEEMLLQMLGDCERELEGVRAFALYLSARERVCEVAVFDCYTRGEAREMAELCVERGAFLMRQEKELTSRVTVKGRYLLWAAGKDADALVATLSRAVK